MDPLDQRPLQAARQAAYQAGRIQAEGLRTDRRVGHKGRFNLVTDIDRQCEQTITRILREAYPQASIFAEESSSLGNEPDSEEVWIVDPLDGTTNYAHGYPAFCVSLALKRSGQIVLGVVYEPIRDELFEAVQGQGARLNGDSIRVTQTSKLSQSLLATGFPYDRCEQTETNLDRFCALTMRTRGVRRGGSAALDLCYTACGRLDGFWEIRLAPWDVDAGALIVQEAGGQVTSTNGGPFDWSGRDLLASNGVLHQTLIQSLADPLPPGPCYG